MKILYGTGNPAKLDAMRKRLEPLAIELIGLKDLSREIPDILEQGTTPLENARQKAVAYYKAFHIPVCTLIMYRKKFSRGFMSERCRVNI